MTQDEWIAELDRLTNNESKLLDDVSQGVFGSNILVFNGRVVGRCCDTLSRWCFQQAGLRPFGITAPSWGCSFRGSKEGELSLAYWSLGVDEIGVYRKDPGEERGMWDRCYVIPDMPIPEENPPPKGLSLEDRRAWLEERRPRQQVLDALALWHLAKWLQKTPEDDR